MADTTAEGVRKAIGAGSRSAYSKVLRYATAFLAVAAIAFVGVRAARSRAASTGPAYESARATRTDIRVTVTATGSLEAVTTVEVGAEVTGRILRVLVDANDIVKKGDLLAEIDPEQLRAAADEAIAQVRSADAAIEQAQATALETDKAASRAHAQADRGLVADKDIEASDASAARAKASLESARASATVARATLTSARSRLDKTKIVAPIDGLVLSRHVEPGQTVTAGFATPLLFRLAQDLTQMRLNVDVDEADVGRVRVGQEASFTVEAYPDRTFSSRVTSLRNEPKTSQNVVTYQGVLSVDNENRLLRPGMTCSATILCDTRNDVLAVPNAALRYSPPTPGTTEGLPPKEVGASKDAGRKQHVWVLKAGKPEPIPVRAGATDGAMTEIVSGNVSPGTEVIVDMREAQ